MKPRKLKPRPKPLLTRKIRYACGPYFDFWLFREGERAYNDYRDLLPRKDAPIRMSYDIYFALPKEFGHGSFGKPCRRRKYSRRWPKLG